MDLRRDRGVHSIAVAELIGAGITVILAAVIYIPVVIAVKQCRRLIVEPFFEPHDSALPAKNVPARDSVPVFLRDANIIMPPAKTRVIYKVICSVFELGCKFCD